MNKRELKIWEGIVESLREPISDKRLWKPDCMSCNMWDKLEDTGCFLNKCKLNNEPTWIK